ncbi:gas vesicle protein GvpG [Kamptonema sp. UHCC 0994]|uniref:gas vesicle protein GvpG n=1 Tax=Kamptonema sp. UHCC 0994 TaxID=3031329 RepID=UPI0023BA6418|nr:gas vesicle protein GvpG [Kamptonema sp. UHCC 0994]MDF0556340.1 gas vesicle protein GvpG [Kamptonema sp. UHCC 0994]
MLFDLLTLPLLGPINGIMWIGEQIQERVDSELDETENLGKQLLALQLAFDLGEVSEEDFEEQEEALLIKIQAMEDMANEE